MKRLLIWPSLSSVLQITGHIVWSYNKSMFLSMCIKYPIEIYRNLEVQRNDSNVYVCVDAYPYQHGC